MKRRGTFISLIALAVLAAPVLCCCAGAFDVPQAAAASVAAEAAECGQCPSAPADDRAPVHHDRSDCGCDRTLTSESNRSGVDFATATPLPVLLVSTPPALPTPLDAAPTRHRNAPGEPPGWQVRDRLARLCVLRL